MLTDHCCRGVNSWRVPLTMLQENNGAGWNLLSKLISSSSSPMKPSVLLDMFDKPPDGPKSKLSMLQFGAKK